MNAIKRIAFAFWAGCLVSFGLLGSAAFAGSKAPVYMKIDDGETAFSVSPDQNMAWWIVGECRKPIELKENTNNSILLSKVITDKVRLGAHHIELKQQFRFSLDASSVDVFNSVRGGWSSLPVTVIENCYQDNACRQRMELPEC